MYVCVTRSRMRECVRACVSGMMNERVPLIPLAVVDVANVLILRGLIAIHSDYSFVSGDELVSHIISYLTNRSPPSVRVLTRVADLTYSLTHSGTRAFHLLTRCLDSWSGAAVLRRRNASKL